MTVRAKAIAVIVLAAICVVTYLPKWDNHFVYDDFAFILDAKENAEIANVPGFFFTDTQRLYRPMRQTLYTLVRHLFGLSAPAHHAVGIALHAAITAMFFLLLLALFKRPRLAFFAAAISALHPVHVARVANTTGSFDLLGIVFAMAALLAAAGYLKQGGPRRLLFALLLFSLGLLSSEEAATVPLFFALQIFLQKNALKNRKNR